MFCYQPKETLLSKDSSPFGKPTGSQITTRSFQGQVVHHFKFCCRFLFLKLLWMSAVLNIKVSARLSSFCRPQGEFISLLSPSSGLAYTLWLVASPPERWLCTNELTSQYRLWVGKWVWSRLSTHACMINKTRNSLKLKKTTTTKKDYPLEFSENNISMLTDWF